MIYLALTEAEMAVLEFIGWCCQRAVELAPIINAQWNESQTAVKSAVWDYIEG